MSVAPIGRWGITPTPGKQSYDSVCTQAVQHKQENERSSVAVRTPKMYHSSHVCVFREISVLSLLLCLQSFEGGGAADEESVGTEDCIQDVIENNSQATCSAQTTEIYIPVPDCLLPRDDKSFHIKDEKEDQLSEENYPMLYTSDPAGSDASDPLATDDLFHVKEENQDHLSEENYPVLNTPDPTGISNYDSDPLTTDELVS
ncbi:uncharacterized protein LOC124172137 [Ischnura elegans]|uniref:uncharacterized protein LOC124172137 n=1 Tax=Ischnura elegans TaxID=197161 RepID=UPI001ED8752A|nr:uncharacterized protein LOC124172137 [Ischnura elegans]